MHGISKSFAASAAMVVMTMGLIAASGQFARAQDADWQYKATGSDVADQPDKAAPLDLGGCWSGTIADEKFGSGTGFLFFVQEGGKAVAGTDGGLETDQYTAEGPLKGTIKKKTFSVKFHAKKCSVSFKGGLPSEDLVGTYHIKCDGKQTQGSFQFSFDESGTSCDL
jgi:hypothetical protein